MSSIGGKKCKVRKEDLSTYQVPYKKGVKYALLLSIDFVSKATMRKEINNHKYFQQLVIS